MSIERVFIVGAGLMGHGIAQVSAAAGKQVTLADRTPELANQGKSRIAGNLARQVEKGRIERTAADATLGRVTTAAGVDGVGGHDLVIEAVFEDEALKRETWAAIAARADPATIFATNTSSISITSLATATDRPARFIGLHFFSPVQVMRLLEIIRGLETDDATCSAARGFAEQLGKEVIKSKDYPGFIVNRMLVPFINEAIRALMEGLGTREDIDQGARLGLHHPMGPLELADFVGLDTHLYICGVLYEGLHDAQFAAPPLLRQLVDAGHFGRKSGRGFYRYGPDGNRVPD